MKHLAGVRVVLISPEGPLNSLPVGHIPGSSPGTFLIQEYAFAIVPVPQLLPELLQIGSAKRLTLPRLLSETSISTHSSWPTRHAQNHFRPLPGTSVEAVIIHDLFRTIFASRPANLLTGKLATKDAFVSSAANYSHLLVATHGFFVSDPKHSESREKGQMQSEEDQLFRRDLVTSNPALRSGLVFAGANYEAIAKGSPS